MGLFSRSSPKLESLEVELSRQSGRVRELLEEIRALELDFKAALRQLQERADKQDKSVRLMAEELEERIDRGNKIWRKIRASEYYEKQREDGEDDEQAVLEFLSEHGNGGEAEAVPPLHRHMGQPRTTTSTAREVGKALARRIAGLE